MNILVVSQHFFPDNFRINDICSALVEGGHEVTVLTSLPDYATGFVPAEYKDKQKRKDTYNGVKVIRTFSVQRRTGVLFRALNYVSFMVSSTVKAKRLKDRFDVVISYQTSPVLMANAARAVSKKQNIPMLLYCLDLWPESLKAWHVGENNLLYKLMRAYSRKIYNYADMVAVSSMPFINYHKRVNQVDEKNMVYLPQHSEDMALAPKPRGEFTRFAFGGNIGSVQNIECIIRAVNRIKDLPDFAVDIYGDGSELENCKKLAESLGVTNKIIFHGRVDREALWQAYQDVDAFLLTIKGRGEIGNTLPAKLQEYMSGNRPIFAAAPSAVSAVISEANCGVAVDDNNDEALACEMRKFILDKEYLKGAGESGRAYFESHFTRQTFIGDLLVYLNKIIADGRKQ